MPAKFEIIEDGLAIQINISDLLVDSDKEGLIDFCEENMLPDLFNSDTDGDGINDFAETNPGFGIEHITMQGYLNDRIKL